MGTSARGPRSERNLLGDRDAPYCGGAWVAWVYLFVRAVQLRLAHLNTCVFYLSGRTVNDDGDEDKGVEVQRGWKYRRLKKAGCRYTQKLGDGYRGDRYRMLLTLYTLVINENQQCKITRLRAWEGCSPFSLPGQQ